MLQFIPHLDQVVQVLGYLSGIATCVTGILAVFGQSDTKVGHAVASVGLDLMKLYKLTQKDPQ